MNKGSVIYIPHGGGPMPLMGDPGHQELVDFLIRAAERWPKPEAIVVVSAHWEEAMPTITGSLKSSLFYDYYGFPAEAYEIKYPALGNPKLARTMTDILASAGIKAHLDGERGLDHGVFIPLKLMYPDADIPCIQISLIRGLDPTSHIRLGRALSPLMEHNILVIGSGMSYHNLQEFFTPDGLTEERNREFHDWLIDTCTGDGWTSEEREARLVDWSSAPQARFCHPREEHLMPLHVCYGMATNTEGEEPDTQVAREIYTGSVMDRRVTALLWN